MNDNLMTKRLCTFLLIMRFSHLLNVFFFNYDFLKLFHPYRQNLIAFPNRHTFVD